MTLQVPNQIPDMGQLAPVPEDLDTWPVRMLELHRWMREDLAPGANALALQTYENALESMNAALSSIASANFKGAWSSLTGALNKPAAAAHSGTVWALLNNLADVTTSQPGVSADWVDIGGIKPSGGIMTGHLSGIAGASGANFPRAQDVAMLATTQLGFRNRLINPFTENQRGLTSVADDTYCLDRWYVLTDGGNVTIAQTTDPESGAPAGIRLTQPDVAAKRIGLAQIIESKDIRQYASQAMHLFARAKLSAATAIRFAIIEHTGTVDVVTSDVVNNWASATFTPGNFFIAGINILKTGTVTPGAATWGSIDDWVALGAGVKNVVIFFWTESALAQNGTLEINRPQLEPGVVATPHEWRLGERALCQRYFVRMYAGVSGVAAAASAGWGNWISWPVVMRATPAVADLGGGSVLNVSSWNMDSTNESGTRGYAVATAAGGFTVHARPITAAAEL